MAGWPPFLHAGIEHLNYEAKESTLRGTIGHPGKAIRSLQLLAPPTKAGKNAPTH